MDTKIKKIKRDRRRKRIRSKIFGTASRPRLSVFRSNRYISAQLINDEKGETLAAATSSKEKGKTVLEKAEATGKKLAEHATEKKIKSAVFDRSGYIYTGSVRALAEGARSGGLDF